MAKKGGGTNQTELKNSQVTTTKEASAWVEVIRQIGTVTAAFIEQFGWHGSILLLMCAAIAFWASPEQKRAMIDMYVLGKGLHPWWVFIVVLGFFLSVLFAQKYWYDKKLQLMQGRLDEIAREKSALHEKLLGKLSHGESQVGKES